MGDFKDGSAFNVNGVLIGGVPDVNCRATFAPGGGGATRNERSSSMALPENVTCKGAKRLRAVELNTLISSHEQL